MATTPEIIGDILACEVAFDGTTFEDVTDYLKSATTKRGANRVTTPALRYEAGTGAAVLKNNDRRFDPTHLTGPYVSGGITQVLPMRPIRYTATWDGTTYGLMRGFVDSWNIDWNGPNWSEVTVPFTDGFKVLEAYDRIAVDPAVGAGEDSGARIDRILDSAGWPAGLRDIATGNTTLQETDLGGTALSECFLTADSELGEFYIDGDGNVVFRNRHGMLLDARSNTVQATFGDSGSELHYAKDGLTLSYDHETLANFAKVTRRGGIEQTATDQDSIDEYLTRTFNRSGLLVENDSDALAHAQWILYTSKEPELRFQSMRINPLRDPDTLFPQVLGREIGDRIQVLMRPPGGGDPITRDVFIRGISHSITPSTWITSWVFQSASKYGSFLVLDNSILGKLDENALGY